MKVLILGNEASLIKSLSYRFYKEGNKICIISKDYIRLNFKYKYYKYKLEEKKLNEVFKKELFDKVIYINEKENSSYLINILTLCNKYKINQFINISSIYEDEIDSGESVCKYFKEVYNFNIAILKVSTIYGVGDKEEYKDRFIFDIFDNLSQNKDDKKYSETKVRDYIEVNDVAKAVSLTSKHCLNGVYSIKSGEILSDKDIYTIVKDTYSGKKIKGIKKSNSPDIEFVERTGFRIKHSLSREIDNILKCFNKKNKYKNNTKTSKKNLIKDICKKCKPYIENISLFLLMVLISYYLQKTNLSLMDVNIKLIYIIIVGITYGSKQSVLSAILSCLLVVGEDLNKGISIISILGITESLVRLIMYLLVGIYVGYKSDSKNNEIKQLNLDIKNLNEEYEFLYDLYDDTYKEKNELEDKVVNTKDGFGKVYNAITKLDSLEPSYILKSSIDILEEFLDNNTIAIYSLNNNHLRLNVKSNNEQFNPPNRIDVEDLKEEIKDILENGEVFVNKGFNDGIPDMIAPINNSNKMIGLIMLEKVEFSKLNLHYQNLFKVITNIIESFIAKAYQYKKITSDQRYLEDTIFLNDKEFEKNLSIRRSAKAEKKLDYIILKVLNKYELKHLSEKIASCIRHTDFAGVDKEKNVYIVLLNTTKEMNSTSVNRLLSLGIDLEIVDEVTVYD